MICVLEEKMMRGEGIVGILLLVCIYVYNMSLVDYGFLMME